MANADDAVKIAVKQLETGVEFKNPRMTQLGKIEAMYNGKLDTAPEGHSNIPFDSVVMQGFVDTLMSKIDEPLTISYKQNLESEKKSADKLTAAVSFESAEDTGAWSSADLDGKKKAALSGRAIYKLVCQRDGNDFHAPLSVVDHYDFVCEPQGGNNLDNHLFKGQMNIYRTRQDLVKGANNGYYDKAQIIKLFKATAGNEKKLNDDIYRHKTKRFNDVKMDIESGAYVGAAIYKIVEWVMYFKTGWYYLVFNYDHGIWLRFEKLEKVFSVAKRVPGRGPWGSWATHRDPDNFWSIGPADAIYPIAYTMKKLIDGTVDNIEKRNWQNRAYDPKVFMDPSKLRWKKDNLVKATLKEGQALNNHIFTFETPDTTNITINLTEYLDGFLGKKTGITADTQGQSEEKKVGIYLGNMQAVSDRLGLTNKQYSKCHTDLGLMFQYGLYDHLPPKYAVKLWGAKGLTWEEEVKKSDLDKKMSVKVTGGNAELKNSEIANQRKQTALGTILKSPVLLPQTNSKWLLREVLDGLGGYNEEAIRTAMDTFNDGDNEILSEAAEAIEQIIDGKNPKTNRGATTGYVQKILNYAYDNEELTKEMFDKLIAFAKLHIPLAQANMIRQARSVAIAAGREPGNVMEPLPVKPELAL